MDRVLAAGYDGVYLDVVDAYWYWRRVHPSSEGDVVAFVKSIATYARETKGHPDFQLFVQNAEEPSVHDDYVQTVSGIGKEDLFYNGNRR